jgi:hypothetical protein
VFPPYSPDLTIADFDLFGWLKQQLSERTLDSEKNLFEIVIEILIGLPKDEVKSTSEHWKEKCQWVADHDGEFYPN